MRVDFNEWGAIEPIPISIKKKKFFGLRMVRGLECRAASTRMVLDQEQLTLND